MKQEPLVSIIMGAYNEEKTIKECIYSILKQSYTNWEFIICNDCSTDNTLLILEYFQNIDSRIKVITNNENRRLAASLNECLKIAQGKYIARMDADDESLPDRIKTEVDFLEEHKDIDVVGCDRIIYDETGDYGVRGSIEFPSKKILIKDTPFAHPTIMMKKEVYDALNGYTVDKTTMRAEDLDLWIRFFAKGFKGYNIQTVLYRYKESRFDLKKRSLKAAIETMKVYWRGYRILKVPLYKRIWIIKPIISAILPDRLMERYYRNKLTKPSS